MSGVEGGQIDNLSIIIVSINFDRIAIIFGNATHQPSEWKQCCKYLDLKHSDPLWSVNVVPDAEGVPVLGNNHIASGHPLHVGAVAQDRAGLCRQSQSPKGELGKMRC